MSKEPNIVINSTILTDSQAMTIRVAIETLAWSVMDSKDKMDKLYMHSIKELRKLYT